MEMAVNARDEEQYGKNDNHLGLGLSLSLGIATAAPVEVEPPPPPPGRQQQQQRAISVEPISSLLPAPQWWNGPAGLFFSPSSGE